ncbi:MULTISPECIES: type II secretion system protein [unclassified Methylobacterium]|uniref:type IV pilus modification PilV family protein n=1 Tax=unclassified Methylobacterium TaxID=2615210 RepID=UPI00226ADB31
MSPLTPIRETGGEDGFTIVEVLVAFAVAALGILLALQIAGETTLGLRRVAALRIEADEAEAVCLRRVAAGSLSPGIVEGRFSNGQPWTLTVSDSRPVLPARRGPPLWRIRLSRGGLDGAALYTTLIPGKPDA